ncbi:AP-4 complex subunit epsilon-1 isoform X1 [Seriola dumerili]|uniref:Adaptor related protein complex 4 subunit epsilon 1 n=1 Tax=Seriola dumerili TaxID=41447 RepID=A0A3B4VCU8_SERDU|nr:AP-4 complex subunit epsilon-1 isoform X1 [Seriola dumerili]
MSDVVEKTLTALPSLLSLDSQPGSAKLSSTSKLGNLIRGITELTSKHEEEKLIQRELASIKEQVSSPNTSMRQMKELMVRAIYCESLGYEASFSYIHAIKLAQQGTVLEKRVGYLAVSLFLNESHELLLLLVNTVLKDLQSTNLIEVCMALTVVSQMFPKDMIPAILPLVEEKLNHPKEIIRRKAVLALYKFYLIAPNQVQHIHNKFRKALCDKDPGVMTASLHIYLQMIQENPEGYKDLTASFVTILKQVVGGKLPMDFNYHSVPAPWLQIQLLRILSLLGKNDPSTSAIMYEVLDESLRRAEMNHNITYAILYECVKCIYTIHPKSDLLEKAAKCIGNFVLSPKINLKYLGLKALTYVVQQDPKLALQHQMTIIECLDHPDLIIKRETLELLFRITNAQNVVVIVKKMLEFLRISTDDYTTIDLVGKVAELAEKYAPDNEWFIETMNTVFSLGGDMMQPDIPNSFLKLLSEGFDSVEEDRKLRLFAVDSYVSLLQGEPGKLPQRFLQVISWVLGEYSHLKEELEPAIVLRLLAKLLDMKQTSSETKSWVLVAMTKLCEGRAGVSVTQEVSETYSSSMDTVLRQRAQELQYLSQDSELRGRVLFRDTGLEPLEVDSSLSFLDGFVSEALATGAAPYKPPHQRQEELAQAKALSLEPYGLSLPISMSSCSINDRQSPTLLSMSSGLSGDSADLSHKGGSTTLKLDGVKRVWGREGYLAQREAVEEAAQVEVPSPLRSPSQQVDADSSHSQTPTLTPTPEPEQEKQQLASSLFFGLSSQSSVCLMGKSEPMPQRFRRKAKGQSSSSGATEQISTSLVSTPTNVDNLLCHNPLDSNITSELAVSPSAQTSELSQGLTTANGTCEIEVELSDSNIKGSNPSLIGDNDLVAADPAAHEDPDRPKDFFISHLPAELSELCHSEITPLCTIQSLDLSACHVQKEDSLVLVIFISNSSDSAIQHILLDLDSEQIEVSCVSDSPVEDLTGHSVAVYQYSLTVKTPSVHVEVVGTVSYQLPVETSQAVQFSYKLPLTSFIRPLAVSTEEYGTMWLAFSHDTKQNLTLISDGQGSLTATLNVLKRKLQLHVVEIIGMEGILSCRLLQDQPCLMHCRVHAGTLAVWLRSPVPDLPDCLIYHCQRALQEH